MVCKNKAGIKQRGSVVLAIWVLIMLFVVGGVSAAEQPTQLYGCMIKKAESISNRSMFELPSLETWQAGLAEKRQQWLEMLGLDPLPERTEMHVTVTSKLERENFIIEKLHFQPIPGCRIAANLYYPKNIKGKLPGVVYVLGHSKCGKFCSYYQAHPRWFAEHGYVAMILDPIQVGENGGFHHGTYSKQWWHWYSQGYTPAGVEVWAAMRAADYLQSRDDVDPEKLGITGLSGGGTISWFTGAADERFKVVAPCCQTGNTFQHVYDRSVDGHCDCSFWVNTLEWDLTDVASLIAPRALLIGGATEDVLFRPYAFRDLAHRVRQLYILHDKEEMFDLDEAVTQHGYSEKMRLAVFNWFERYLKGTDVVITEDISGELEVDKDLAVYPDMKPPVDDKLKDVDKTFIKLPTPPVVTSRTGWEQHQQASLQKLRTMTFRQIPEVILPPVVSSRNMGQSRTSFRYRNYEFCSEPGMLIRLNMALPHDTSKGFPVVMAPLSAKARTPFMAAGGGNAQFKPEVTAYAVAEVRGTGASSIGIGLEWTARRAYPLVGQTIFERKTLDLLTAIQVARQERNITEVVLFGEGEEAAIAIYAALLDPAIKEVILRDPVVTHWESGPEFINVLKTGDLPHNLALMFPRVITFIGKVPKEYEWTRECYHKCGMSQNFRLIKSQGDWKPLE